MTFLELQAEVLLRVGEPIPPSTAQRFHSITDAKAALNEGLELMAETSGFYEVSANINITSALYYDLNNTAILNLGANITFVELESLFSNQNNRWLTPTYYRELDETIYPVWERSIGEPDYYLTRGVWWVGLYPHKTSTSGTLTANCNGIPAPMVNDADTPGFPREFDEGLVNYAVYHLFCSEREWSKAKRHWAIYRGWQDRLDEYVNHRAMVARMTQFGGVV